MSSDLGKNIRVTIFGQSHSAAIGAVIDGLPAGEKIDMEQVRDFLGRRAPGSGSHVTRRKEKDEPVILSGLINGITCGAPLSAVIENTDARSKDYDALRYVPRPSHADYPAYVKYGGFNDIRGGGHFSGRMTAPLCFAGAVCKQILERRGVHVGAHIAAIGSEKDEAFDPVSVDPGLFEVIAQKSFPTISDEAGERMLALIHSVAEKRDSLGGVVECAATGMSAGVGDPMFDGIENRLAAAIFGIPAVRGIEFGAGFEAAEMKGSEHNDPYYYEDGKVTTRTNNHGGILGGLTSGMPVIFRTAFKPTPSTGLEQKSVDLKQKTDVSLVIEGRHDPCIVPRAVIAVEAAAAIVFADFLI